MSTYTDEATIKLVYGVTSVDKWANLDNDANATKMTNRINRAISIASEEIDDILRSSPYKGPPYTKADGTTTPTIIAEIASVLAGLWLYESRGAIDVDEQGKPVHGHAFRRRWAYEKLHRIRKGDDTIDALK